MAFGKNNQMKSKSNVRKALIFIISLFIPAYSSYVFLQIVFSPSDIIHQIWWWPLISTVGSVYLLIRPMKNKERKKAKIFTICFILSLIFTLVLGAFFLVYPFEYILEIPIVGNNADISFIFVERILEPNQLIHIITAFHQWIVIILMAGLPTLFLLLREASIYTFNRRLKQMHAN